jgi:signal transduction histidine kinase
VSTLTMDTPWLFGCRVPGLDAISKPLGSGRHRQQAVVDHATHANPQLLATLQHELNTPLNAILGFSEMLEMGIAGTLDPRQHEYVGHIHQSAQRLHTVIREILERASEAG